MKAQCLPFAQIPHATRLFLDYLSYSEKVRSFYPRTSLLSDWLQDETAALRYDPSRRERVSTILERQNKAWDASPKSLQNLARLRAGACAVVTGQQVGLFGGPAFSLFKALTAIKLAAEATAAGVECVPVFWLATEDHDLAEVNQVSLPGPQGSLQKLAATTQSLPDAPVSTVQFGEEIAPTVQAAIGLLGESDISGWLRDCYRPGET